MTVVSCGISLSCMKRYRTENLTVRVAPDEVAMVRALADDGDESAGRVIRRLVAAAYRERFGDVPPPRRRRTRRKPKATSTPTTTETTPVTTTEAHS